VTIITRYPTSNAVGTTGWTNPGNAYADDAVYATAAPAKNGTVSSYFSGFDFSDIGVNDTINSVTVTFEYHVSTTASVATLRTQAFDGATQIGTTLNHTAEPTTDLVRTLVIPATLANLQSADFKILSSAIRGSSTTAVTFYLDYVCVVVDYTPGSTSVTGSFSQTLESAAFSANGKVEVKGAVFSTLQDSSLAATGHVQADSITASLSQELQAVSASATGSVKVSGVVSATLGGVSLSSSAKAIVKSALTSYLDSCTVAASGKVAVKGTVSKSLDSCAFSATGKATIKGAVSHTLENVGLVATSGASYPSITANANITLANVGIVSIGKALVKAGSNITLESVGMNATGKVKVSGEVAQTLSDVISEVNASAMCPRTRPTKFYIKKPAENSVVVIEKQRIHSVRRQAKINTAGRGD